MIHTLFFLLFFAKGQAIFFPTHPNKSTFETYQLWQVDTKNKNLSTDFEDRIAEKDVWHRSDNNIDFLLNGNETEYWNKFLESQNISYEIILDDAHKAFENMSSMKKYGDWRRDGSIDWSSYPKLPDIYAYLKSVAAADTKSCSLQTIGKTSHRKDIQMLKLSNGKPDNEAFLIEAGLHGREWVSILAALYFIESIAWNFTQQPDYIKNKDWYIIPVVNPEGYEYSMTKDRFWRKNRRRFSGPCVGVDLNRNFDYNWCTRHASKDLCAVDFCGFYPFSEEETIAIKKVVEGRHFLGYVGIHSYGSAVLFPWLYDGSTTIHREDHIKVAREMVMKVVEGRHFLGYVGIHSYGSAVLFPWLYDGSTTIHREDHIKVAREMVMAMRQVDRTHFKAGTVSLLHLRKGSGTAQDWAYSQDIQHSYLIETRGERIGQYHLEANQLLPAVKEVTAGLRRMAEVIL